MYYHLIKYVYTNQFINVFQLVGGYLALMGLARYPNVFKVLRVLVYVRLHQLIM